MPSNTADGYIYIDLQLRQDEFEKRLAQVEGKTSSFASKIKNTLLAIGIGAMAKQAAGYIYNVGAEFEAAMSRVQAISGATGKDLEALTEKAKELGASTKYSAPEVAAAMEEMAKAGWNTQQILEGMEGVLDAAAASGEGLATTSTIVADAITGFGLAAKDSTHVADLLTQAANAGTIDIADLGETFKYIAPVARTMGLSIEDVTTAVSAMSMAGIKGSQAGTSLRTVLTRMVKPTEAVSVAMNELGINLTNQDGSFKSLDQIVKEMRKSFSGLTDEQKTYYATILAGQEGMSGLLALLNLSQDEYDAIAESMDNCNGVAKETAAVMQQNLSSAMEQLGGGLETIAISIYEKVAPALTEFVNYITNNVLPVINDFIVNIEEWYPTINRIIGILAGLTSGFIAFKSALAVKGAIKNVKTLYNTFSGLRSLGFSNITSFLGILEKGKGIFATLAANAISAGSGLKGLGSALVSMAGGPVTIAIAAITAIVAAIIYFWNTSEDFKNFVISCWNSILSALGSAATAIAGFFTETIPSAFNSFIELLKSFGNSIASFFTQTIPSAFNSLLTWFSQLPTAIGTWLTNTWNSIVLWGQNLLAKAIEIGSNFLNGILNFFDQLPYMIGYAIGLALGQIIQWGIDLYNFATVDIPNFISMVAEWFAQLPGKIKETVDIMIATVTKWLTDMYNSAVQWISQTVNSIVNWFSQLPGKVATWLSNTYTRVTTWGSNMLNKAKSIASNFINGIINYIKQLPGKIATWLTSAASKVVSWGSDLAAKGKAAATKLLNAVVNGVKSIPSKMVSIGSDMVKGLWNGINDMVGWIGNKIKSFGSGVLDGIKDFFGIHSPSKLMADEVGKYLPKGIAVGFKAEMPNTENEMVSNTRRMVDDFKNEVNTSVNRNQGNGPYDPGPGNPGNDPIDYTRLGNEMVNAFAKSGVTVNIDKRKAGRILKEVQ